MAININPSFINFPSNQTGQVGQAGVDQGQQQRQQPPQAQTNTVTPTPASVNNIPSPQSLSTLVNSAVASKNSGVTWDRGTILNLLV